MRASRRHSLEYKLPVFFTGLLAFVILALALLARREVRLLARERAEARLISVSQQFASSSAEGTLRRIGALSTAANRPDVIAALRQPTPVNIERARLVLSTIAPTDTTIVATGLRDARDRLVAFTGDSALARRSVLPELPGDSLTGVGPFTRFDSLIVYSTSVRVVDEGRALGRVAQWRRIVLTPQVRDAFRSFIGSEAELYFGNRSGDLWFGLGGRITHGPPDSVPPGQVARWTREDGGEQLGITRPLSTTPWAMTAEIPLSFVTSQPRAFMRRFAVIALLLLVLGALLAMALSRRLTAPLVALTEATEAIAAGDYSRQIQETGDDEIGRLARAFRIMSLRVQDTHRLLEADIADRRQEVRETQDKLQAAVGALPPDRRLPGDRGPD
jgi:HAMP domain-containing protein